MTSKSKSTIIIRQGRLGDEKGICQMQRIGLKLKNWVYNGTNQVTREKMEKMRERFKAKVPDSYCFVAIDKRKDMIVGSVGLDFKKNGRLRHRVNVGWGVHPDYQKKGIATMLLDKALRYAKAKGFKRAEAEAAVRNKGSLALAEKCGFRIEGRKRKALLTDEGEYIDTFVLGKLL